MTQTTHTPLEAVAETPAQYTMRGTTLHVQVPLDDEVNREYGEAFDLDLSQYPELSAALAFVPANCTSLATEKTTYRRAAIVRDSDDRLVSVRTAYGGTVDLSDVFDMADWLSGEF